MPDLISSVVSEMTSLGEQYELLDTVTKSWFMPDFGGMMEQWQKEQGECNHFSGLSLLQVQRRVLNEMPVNTKQRVN